VNDDLLLMIPLQHKANPNLAVVNGTAALHKLALAGAYVEMAKVLLDHGAEVHFCVSSLLQSRLTL